MHKNICQGYEFLSKQVRHPPIPTSEFYYINTWHTGWFVSRKNEKKAENGSLALVLSICTASLFSFLLCSTAPMGTSRRNWQRNDRNTTQTVEPAGGGNARRSVHNRIRSITCYGLNQKSAKFQDL